MEERIYMKFVIKFQNRLRITIHSTRSPWELLVWGQAVKIQALQAHYQFFHSMIVFDNMIEVEMIFFQNISTW